MNNSKINVNDISRNPMEKVHGFMWHTTGNEINYLRAWNNVRGTVAFSMASSLLVPLNFVFKEKIHEIQ